MFWYCVCDRDFLIFLGRLWKAVVIFVASVLVSSPLFLNLQVCFCFVLSFFCFLSFTLSFMRLLSFTLIFFIFLTLFYLLYFFDILNFSLMVFSLFDAFPCISVFLFAVFWLFHFSMNYQMNGFLLLLIFVIYVKYCIKSLFYSYNQGSCFNPPCSNMA